MASKRGKGAGPGKGIRKPPPEAAARAKTVVRSTGEEAHLPWGRRNAMILAAGGVAIVIGFLLLALGDTIFAPILLVGGYLGLIPWGIVASAKGRNRAKQGDQLSQKTSVAGE